jgi:hypothetical protein
MNNRFFGHFRVVIIRNTAHNVFFIVFVYLFSQKGYTFNKFSLVCNEGFIGFMFVT